MFLDVIYVLQTWDAHDRRDKVGNQIDEHLQENLD